jgi:hypothetical protein
MITMLGFPSPVSKLYYGWDKGLERHGDKFIHLSSNPINLKKVPYADSYYQTNLLKPKHHAKDRSNTQGNLYQYILDSKKPFIVSESNPFRKYPGWTRFGWWSYKWTDANCNNDDVEPERWNAYEKSTGITFKDWHSPGDAIVIMGQKENDSSLVKLYDTYDSFYDWVLDVIETVRKYSDRPIVVRPHPKNEARNIGRIRECILSKNIKGVDISENRSTGGNQGGESLDKDLTNAHCVITYNSLSGVEAVEAGIPTFAMDDGSMVWPVAHKDLSQIENLNYNIDLQDWKNKIAYTMWNKEEVMSGECWAHLKPVYFKG